VSLSSLLLLISLTISCYDIDFNVGAAARLFKGYVDAAGGNVLVASGQYNGWRVGMTSDDAQAAKWQGNCHAQNNLDYLHQLFNGWCQGKSAYTMGTWCKSFVTACMIFLINSQLGRMLNPTRITIYDLMKRTLDLYIIYSTRCSVDRLGWGFALNAYLLVFLFPLPHGSLRPSVLEPIRHDLLGLVAISLNIVVESEHRCIGVERTQGTSCVIRIADHVEFCFGMTCHQSQPVRLVTHQIRKDIVTAI